MKVGILGAGIAGLSAGWLLQRRGVDVTIFERQPYVGGLARSFQWNGFSCDFAAHRLFCTDEVVLRQLLEIVPMGRHIRRSQIRLGGKWLRDPVNISELMVRFFPRTAARIALTYALRPRSLEPHSFETYVLARYGAGLSDFFFRPYTEKLFGIPAEQIALDWAVRKVRIAGPLDALRASTKKNFSYFYYPIRGGYGAISDRMAAELGDRVKLETTVKELRLEGGRIESVVHERGGQEQTDQFDHVISTLPLTLLGRMLGNSFALSYRKVEAVYLLVNKPYVSDNHWTYFMDRDAAINRMVEFKNMSPTDCPADCSVLCAEVTGEHDDVVEKVIDDVVAAGMARREDILDTLVVREPFSYPIYDLRYQETVAQARRVVEQYSNLHVLGRAAEFEHKEIDDNFASALALVEKIARREHVTLTAPEAPALASAQQDRPLVHIVILAYNNVADTLECLETVQALEYERFEVVLVDNGSTDNTPELVRARFPEVEVIETGQNLGVPRGFNVGFARALDAGADHVLMLNNDTTVAPDMLDELLATAAQNPKLGIAMPKVLYYDHPDVVWSAGGRYRRFPPAIVFVGLDRPDREQFSELRTIEYAPSCGILISRQAFEKAGLFDPGYMFYYDDWDFSERVRAHGLEIVFVPTAKMWHKVSRSTRSHSELFWRVWGESCVRFYRRHGRPVFLSLPIHFGYIVLREALKGNVRSLRYFLAGAWHGLLKPLGPIPQASDHEPLHGG